MAFQQRDRKSVTLALSQGGLLACWRARAIDEKFLRVSKLALVAKQAWFSGHVGRTWIDHNENGLLSNVIERTRGWKS